MLGVVVPPLAAKIKSLAHYAKGISNKNCISIPKKGLILAKFPHGTRSLLVKVTNFILPKRVVNNITYTFL